MKTAARAVVAIVVGSLLAVALEWLAAAAGDRLTTWRRRGPIRMSVQAGTVVCMVIGLALGAEASTRVLAPQEINGWGERPSLQPSAAFGWTLRPSSTTTVRWQTYDDTIHANALGFPGPLYPVAKPAGTYRVLVTGDAFSSADGVPTSDAWPRLLESDLSKSLGRPVQVLNFSITGYGPSQEMRVLQKYVPIYRPDLVITEWFVNDYDDVMLTDADFQQQIGFGQPSPDSISAYVHLGNLRQWLKLDVKDRLETTLLGRVSQETTEFARLGDLRKGAVTPTSPAQQAMTADYAQMATVARDSGAGFMVAMVPASVQVCATSALGYSFAGVQLSDSSKYDLNGPQSLAQAAFKAAGVANVLDLRQALRASPACVYRKHNMHWTVEGHVIAAQAVSAWVTSDVAQEGK